MVDPRRLPGPESLGDLVIVSSPRVDPSGRRVFYVVTRVDLEGDRYESSIWVHDVSGERRVLESGPGDLCPVPGPLGERYVFTRRLEDRRRRGMAELRSSTVGSTGSQVLMRARWFTSPAWSPDGRLLAVAAAVGDKEEDVKHIEGLPLWFNGRGWVYNVTVRPFLLDPEAGAGVEIDLGLRWLMVDSLAWSPDGKRLAIVTRYEVEKPYLARIYVYDVQAGEARVLAEGFAGYGEVAWSPDGRSIAFLGHRLERGLSSHNRVYIVDVETGEYREECVTSYEHVGRVNSDARGPSCSRALEWTEEGLFFIDSIGGRQVLVKCRPGRELETLVDPGEGAVDEFSASRSGKTVAYTVMSAVEPKDLYLLQAGVVTRLTRTGEAWRRKYRVAEVERLSFKASDGAEIEGWLFKPPPGVEEKGWVLYIHGGPKTMWGYGFMHEFHVLAASGYTVAAFNPRGSAGYSEEFADIRCRYGDRDYLDLMEAYRFLVEEQGLPRDRAAVAGGSYGGFMVNWIVGNTTVFKAAVSMRGISSWLSMYGTSDIGWYFVEDQLCCTPWESQERCWDRSPLRLAPRVKTPTLIIHSMEDYRCWLDQAVQWYTALRLHGVETRLVLFPRENHDLSRSGKPRHRVERLREILRWLDKHLSPGGGGGGS